MPSAPDKTPWKMEPEFTKSTAALFAARSVTPRIPASAVTIRRQMQNATSMMLRYSRKVKIDPRVQKKAYEFHSSVDGAVLKIWHYWRSDIDKAGPPTAAMLHCHAGGFIAGSPEIYDEGPQLHTGNIGVPWFSVGFRLAPERKHPTQLQDCFDGLQWLMAHAAEFNVDRKRIAVVGENSGGALAIGVAMRARDTAMAPPLAKMILVYPMLDDRVLSPDPKIEPLSTWTVDDIVCGWTSVLNEKPGSDGVPVLAAPGRAEVQDLVGLPPTYLEVGIIDTLRDQCVDFMQKLVKASVMTEFHLLPGQVHGAEFVAPETKYNQRIMKMREQSMLDF